MLEHLKKYKKYEKNKKEWVLYQNYLTKKILKCARSSRSISPGYARIFKDLKFQASNLKHDHQSLPNIIKVHANNVDKEEFFIKRELMTK